jgi:peptidoglycan/LPS O-acetylase OafA/YrhL
MTMSKPSVAAPAGVRLVQLDVLRALAILLVLFRHAIIPWSQSGMLMRPMKFLYHLGWTGVDLFFVLSGFLIGGLLFKEIRTTGRLDVGRFLVRRMLKIWPAYFVLVGFVFFQIALTNGGTFRAAFHDILPNLLHLQNYLGTRIGITWSLAVEEHFYLALPVVLVLVTAGWRNVKSIPAIPIIALLLIVACNLMRVAFNWNRGFDLFTHQYATHLRIDGLFFGVMLAYLHHFHPSVLQRVARRPLLLVAVGLALVFPMGIYEVGVYRWVWTIGYTMLYVGYGCILIACVYSSPRTHPLGRMLASRGAAALGAVGVFSYSIYLWQFSLGQEPLVWWLLPHLPHKPVSLFWLLSMSSYFGVAILAGVVMAKLVEMPVLAVRDRVFPPKSSSPATPDLAASRGEAAKAEASLAGRE